MKDVRGWANDWPLSVRVTVSIAVILILALGAFGYVANREVRSVVLPAELERLGNHARLLTQQLNSDVREARANLVAVIDVPPVAGIVRARQAGGIDPVDRSSEAQWRARLAAIFYSMLAAHPDYLQLRLIDASDGGREIVRVDRKKAGDRPRVVPPAELQPKGDRPYFEDTVKLAPGQLYVSPIELNQEFGRVEVPHVPVIRIGAAVREQDREVVAAVVLNVDMRPSLSRISKSLFKNGNVYVVGADGSYLLHPDSSREFGKDLGHSWRVASDWSDLAPLFDDDGVATRIIELKSGIRQAVAVSSERLAGAVPVSVIESAPYAAIVRPATIVGQTFVVGGACAAVVAILVAVLLTRTLIKPLNQMAVALDAFGGDAPVTLPAGGGREIGALRRAFMRMGDEVRARTDALRAEIAERERVEAALTRYANAARLHAAVVESSNDAIVTETLDGIITGWNKGAEDVFGYTAAEAIGQSIDIFIPEHLRAEAHAMLAEVAKGDRVAHHETVRRTKGGRLIDVSLSVSPIMSEDGRIVGAAKIARDVSARRTAEDRFRLVFDASSAGMIMADAGGTIVLANAEAERLFGYDRGELIGLSVEKLVPERARARHKLDRKAYQEAPEQRAMGKGRDLAALRKDGTVFPVEIGLNPLTTGDVPMTLSVVVDLTERQRAAAQLAQQADELRRSNEELEQFAYVASHDLQEPLRMVASYTELLAERYKGRLDERADKYIGYATEGAHRMQKLVADLLAYSRVGSQGKSLGSTDAEAVYHHVLRAMRGVIRDSGGVVSHETLPVVMADDNQLAQLFQNLLSNALKFHGDKTPIVKIQAQRDGDEWVFSVADNGIGIDPQYQNEIFQMFRRLHTRDKYDGNGIGLTIAKRIVERHGGRIWLKSTPGVGTTFYFTMRAAPAEART